MAARYQWSDYVRRILEEAAEWVNKFPPETNPQLSQAIENHLFDLEGPIAVQRSLGRDENYFSIVFRGFVEISACIERMEDIVRYIGSFPYKSTDLDRLRCLRYHIENYFHEAYMLRERLKAYFTRVERAFAKDRRHAAIASALRPLAASCAATLKGISNTRSGHVHNLRFDAKDLSKLELLRLLSGYGDLPEVMRNYYDHEYRRIRSEWKRLFKRNNREITKLLDTVANGLIPVLFDLSRGKLRYPRATAA